MGARIGIEMPNLPGRYEHSVQKGEAERPTAVDTSGKPFVPCRLGGMVLVGEGQSCVACATEAVRLWRVGLTGHPRMR